MGRSTGRRSLRATLLVAALALPALSAVQLVRAVTAPEAALQGLRLSDGASQADAPTLDDLLPQRPSGVLYTRGRASVNWNGVGIPVEDGSYAYEGGESVTLAPDAMGLLQLAGGGTVFICSGATARVTRGEDGVTVVDVEQGAARFAFPRGDRFQVRVNAVLVGPSTAGPGAALEDHFVGEVKARERGGCVLCALKNDLGLAPAAGPGGAERTRAGQIAEVQPPGKDGRTGLEVSFAAIPSQALSLIQAASAGDGAGAQYLCRCEELNEAARDRGAPVTAQDAENQAPEAQARLPDSTPEILPPDAPPLALADPGAPDPFDPNVLPPPAAGEPTDPVVTVAPPAVPGGGNGGGGVASPS